ncbi:MAG: glycosyltransferase family 2 protein [Calditrichaeota bacterium]|nr:MAG: glycosyltransferase family 2 protein [Calditrichota bacterium]
MAKNKIVIISPVRDEADLIQGTIDSTVNQTLRPVEWIIVDDGSTDGTTEIVEKACAKHDWIHIVKKPNRGVRAVGPGVVEAFYYGYDRIKTKDYDFVCKMDGDIEFKPKYFETLVSLFKNDKYLGAASGKPFQRADDGTLTEERHNDEMVAGMINFYKRKCFEDMGGFVREVHWDGIAYHACRIAGWRTGSFRHEDLNFLHLRLMGSSHKGIIHGRMRWGKGQYFMGTHPLYIFGIGAYRTFEKPFLIGGFFIVIGYFRAMLAGMRRFGDDKFRKSLHAWQFENLGIGKRLEQIPPPEPEKD